MTDRPLTARAIQPSAASRPSNNPKTRPSITERALNGVQFAQGHRAGRTPHSLLRGAFCRCGNPSPRVRFPVRRLPTSCLSPCSPRCVTGPRLGQGCVKVFIHTNPCRMARIRVVYHKARIRWPSCRSLLRASSCLRLWPHPCASSPCSETMPRRPHLLSSPPRPSSSFIVMAFPALVFPLLGLSLFALWSPRLSAILLHGGPLVVRMARDTSTRSGRRTKPPQGMCRLPSLFRVS